MAVENINTAIGLSHAVNEAELLMNGIEGLMNSELGTESMVDSCIKRLEAYIEILKKREEKIYALFKNVNGRAIHNEAELQEAFRQYQFNSGLEHFTGLNLEKTILRNYRYQVDKEKQKLLNFIDGVIIPVMADELLNNKKLQKSVEDLTGQKALAKIFNYALTDLYVWNLTEGTIKPRHNSKTGFTRKQEVIDIHNDYNQVMNNFKDVQFDLDQLSRTQKQRLKDLSGVNIDKLKIEWDTKIEITEGSISAKYTSKWYKATQFNGYVLSAEEAKKEYKDKPNELKQINQEIINLIKEQVNGDYKTVVEKYIWNMLKTRDEYMFFAGANSSDITGILGEISAMVTIGELLNVDGQKILDWVGNHKIDNKKVSIDILLKDIADLGDIGIQVKNSAQDLNNIPELDIHFAGKNTSSILESLEEAYPQYNFKGLEDVFDSEAFNIPAKPHGQDGWVEASIDTSFYNHTSFYWQYLWGLFKSAYKRMQIVIERAKNFLTGFAPDFLYMSGGENLKSQLANLDAALSKATGNDLYIVGGTPYVASSMLETIIKDLEALKELKEESERTKHFLLSSSFDMIVKGKNAIAYNYISWVNSSRSLKSRKSKLTSAYAFPAQ